MNKLLPSGKSEGYEVCADDVALAVISPVAARNRAQAGVGGQGGFAPPCAADLPLTAHSRLCFFSGKRRGHILQSRPLFHDWKRAGEKG